MKKGIVDTVIEVDTFTLKTGETIKLTCVDAPVAGTPNAAKAREELNRLIGRKLINCDINTAGLTPSAANPSSILYPLGLCQDWKRHLPPPDKAVRMNI